MVLEAGFRRLVRIESPKVLKETVSSAIYPSLLATQVLTDDDLFNCRGGVDVLEADGDARTKTV